MDTQRKTLQKLKESCKTPEDAFRIYTEQLPKDLNPIVLRDRKHRARKFLNIKNTENGN